MSNYAEIVVKVEFEDRVIHLEDDCIIDALHHFGEYNDKIISFKWVKQ